MNVLETLEWNGCGAFVDQGAALSRGVSMTGRGSFSARMGRIHSAFQNHLSCYVSIAWGIAFGKLREEECSSELARVAYRVYVLSPKVEGEE